MALALSTTLSYYKRKDIRSAMALQCRNKEVAVKYGSGFGKRPDIIVYDNDILSFAQKKATSFHISEETWSNPLQLSTGMRQSELDELRIGWDFVIDIDFPIWEATRIITHAIVEELIRQGVPEDVIHIKFSGNKGFHIIIPFEAFPEEYITDDEVLSSDLFPDGVRRMLQYLIHCVDGPENGFSLSEQLFSLPEVRAREDIFISVDERSGKQLSQAIIGGNEFVCKECEVSARSEEEYRTCEKCGSFMERVFTPARDTVSEHKKVSLDVDTLLVSNRHMYRLVYSLHEKSGLASIPVPRSDILSFSRADAHPDKVTVSESFLSRHIPRGCAKQFFYSALAFRPPEEVQRKSFSEIVWEGEAAEEALFPPPIRALLSGVSDGRKRALFVLTNFLSSVGWSVEMIEARLLEWNDSLSDPAKESDIRNHLRYHAKKSESVLPPNFDNDMYYRDILGDRFVHDELSARIKNPVQYVRLMKKRVNNKNSFASK